MERVLWFGVGLVIIVVVIGAGFYFLGGVQESPNIGLEDCKSYSYNGEGKTSLVFFAQENEVKKYMDSLYGFEPFSSNKDVFNVFYIDDYEPECELYKDVAVLCYNRALIKKAGSCPNDIIVVIKEMGLSVRSAAYMNVVSLNSKLPVSVFAHELVHALANLADEYVPAKLPRSAKNCVRDCNEFDVKDGCYGGCSESDYFRSVDNGLMKTLRSDHYGVFNEKLILKELGIAGGSITGGAINEFGECVDEKYYLVEGVYNGDQVDISKQRLEIGCVGGNGAGAFEFKILDSSGDVVSGEDFNPELIFTDGVAGEDILVGGAIESDKPFILKVPIVEGGEELDIRKDGVSLNVVSLGDERGGSRPCRIG
jgi:hypothetical protein